MTSHPFHSSCVMRALMWSGTRQFIYLPKKCNAYIISFVHPTAADNVVLTSSVMDDGRRFACPNELVTFTCQLNEAVILQWNSPLISNSIIYQSTDEAPLSTPSSPFFATLTNRTGSGTANFTSTLQVNASRDFSSTDATVECRNQASDSKQLNFSTPGINNNVNV